MTGRLVIITEIIAPYRIPLFNDLAQSGAADLHVIFLAETDPVLRQWQVYKDEIRFSYGVLPSWRKRIGGYNALVNRGVWRALVQAKPDVILCGGYNYLGSWQALLWARARGVPFLLWSESNLDDMRPGHAVIELLKQEFLRACSGFVVPGQAAWDYLKAHKISDDRIFTASNAVDNEMFSAGAADARRDAVRLRRELDLPARYFLFTGRLVREKGVFELLAAYAKLDRSLREQIGLVFVGDGPCRKELEEQARAIEPGLIRFPGFAQREKLAGYYGLAEMLVLPTYSDTWGLVVNEAMACGLPVILTRAAGCGRELVTQGWNGMLIPARDVESLAAAMQTMASDPERSAAMGANSSRRIAEFSPAAWTKGITHMLEGASYKQ